MVLLIKTRPQSPGCATTAQSFHMTLGRRSSYRVETAANGEKVLPSRDPLTDPLRGTDRCAASGGATGQNGDRRIARTAMPTFSSLMRMRCTLPSRGDVFRSVSCQFRLSRTRNCPAAVPRADRLAGDPSFLTRLWFLRCRTCVRPACNHDCDGGRDDSRCQQCAEAQQG